MSDDTLASESTAPDPNDPEANEADEIKAREAESTGTPPTFDLTSSSVGDTGTTADPQPNASNETDAEATEAGVKVSEPLSQEQRELYYVTHLDPARQISPTGVYLDDVQRVEAEKVRAQVEGREPDLDNPPPVQGTPLQSAAAINHSLSTLNTANVEPDVVLDEN